MQLLHRLAMSVCNLVDDPLPVIVVLVVMFLIFVFDWTYMSVPKASDLPMLARYFVGSVIDLSSLLTVAILTLPYLLFFDRSHAKEPDPSLPLVILVHGTNASPLEYLAVQWYLRVRRIPHYSASYKSWRSIHQSVEEVATHVKAEMDLQEHQGLVFVGHSQGGLIARMLSRQFSEEGRGHDVRLCVTLNAPQQGARGATYRNAVTRGMGKVPTQSYQDMDPGSDFIQNYIDSVEDETFDTFETSGFIDFLGFREAETGHARYRYRSFFGHNFCSVNPWLWTQHLCPLILSFSQNT